MSADERVVFWDCVPDKERLYHSDREDAIEDHLDQMLNPKMTAADVLAALPEKVTVYGWARTEVDRAKLAKLLSESALEDLLERLDEDYGDPDGDPTDPTEKMQQAEAAFIRVVLDEYVPWSCEKVCEEEVDVEAWVRRYRPDWLKDGAA